MKWICSVRPYDPGCGTPRRQDFLSAFPRSSDEKPARGQPTRSRRLGAIVYGRRLQRHGRRASAALTSRRCGPPGGQTTPVQDDRNGVPGRNAVLPRAANLGPRVWRILAYLRRSPQRPGSMRPVATGRLGNSSSSQCLGCHGWVKRGRWGRTDTNRRCARARSPGAQSRGTVGDFRTGYSLSP